jgi:release factor glutamine methyltransferase
VTARRCAFGPLEVVYDDETVLAPRPWTLAQSRCAAERLRGAPPGPIVELHCGAGQIGQAAARWADRPVVQVDDDMRCCRCAADNARRNGVHALVVRARADALPFRDECAALVVADPPYVPSREVARFPGDPGHAIDGGDDGFDGVRACVPAAAALVRHGGSIVLQVRGPAQARAVADMVANDRRIDLVETTAAADDRAIVALLRC